jgi:hypothetical protein
MMLQAQILSRSGAVLYVETVDVSTPSEARALRERMEAKVDDPSLVQIVADGAPKALGGLKPKKSRDEEIRLHYRLLVRS